MEIIDIPGIRYKGREMAIEKFGVETTDEDIQVALEIRELLLPRNETTVDRKVGFGWFVDKTGTCHYLNTR